MTKGFIWNRSNCEWECDKSCNVVEHLDYANCKCRKKSVDKLVQECTENIDEIKITGMALSERGDDCKSSCTIYVVLIELVFTINIGIGSYFIY